ncbi:MAG: hypothetical protein K9H61_04150 [Bacteroidia bacterium]|nr:hypothetical protein [Bacteroidia bacterium]MCF8426400.1 hypothetical protein [Bacteroidia bacterium]MCF8446168.1 hypothetical protein [Bacteroidia bacterium]
MKKTLLLILFFNYLNHSLLSAQNSADSIPKRHLGISANAGTTGFGGSLNIKLAKKIEFNIGYSMINLSTKLETTFDGQTVDLTVINKNNYTSFIFNLYPSVNSSFHFLLGTLYSGNQFTIRAISKDSQDYGQIVFAPDQLGVLIFDLNGNKWQPIAGIGFGRSIPNKRLGFGFDLGAAYMGKLKSTIIADKAFEPTANESNEAVLNNAFSSINWLPFINFRLNIKLF